MENNRVIIIGCGDVGKAIGELCEKAGYRVSCKDKRTQTLQDKEFDIMHICFPQKDKNSFYEEVARYINKFKPELVIINSTVVPGTTRMIADHFAVYKQGIKIVHSPIQGQHDKLLFWIRKHTKWIGGIDEESSKLAWKHFDKLGLKARTVKKPEQTELAKLLDVTQYTLLIAWAQEAERICKKFNVEHFFVREFGKEVHEFLGTRPDIYPGVAGGNCLIPDLKLLQEVYDSKFFEAMLESNQRRDEEYVKTGR